MGDCQENSAAKRQKLDEEYCGKVLRERNVLEELLQKNANNSVIATKFQDKDEDLFIQNVCQKYKTITRIPMLSSAYVVKDENEVSGQKYSILARYSQHDLVNKQEVKFERASKVHVNWEEKSVQCYESPVVKQTENMIKQSIPNDGKFRAIIRKLEKKEKPKYILEVWSNYMMHKAIDLSAFDVHGDVYADDTFSSLRWSPDCKKVVYIAEKKKKNLNSYFDQVDSSCLEKEETKKKSKGEEYLYEEDWGELKNGLCCPVIVVVDVVDELVKVLDDVPSAVSPGQAVWASNDSIIFVGWWNNPFKLGLVYCHNRRSAIFQLTLSGDGAECRQLSDDDCSVHSPSISPDQSKLVFLERDQGGPHEGCKRLMMYDMVLKTKCSVVYDIVQIASDLEIPLYSMSFSEHCWSQNGEFVILDTTFKCNKIIVMIEVKTGKMSRLTVKDGFWSLRDICCDVILASYSSPNTPDQLMIGRLSFNNKPIDWILLSNETPQYFKSLKESINWEKFCLAPNDPVQGLMMESIIVRPVMSSSTNPPLIIWPHGGPHSCAMASFSYYVASFTVIGCAVLLVNYRGSTGFGEYPLHSLLGKIGLQDVQDVQAFAEAAIKTEQFDRKNIFIFGGSHGGFLSAHLVGQYPDFYRACALRNPVVNLPAMVGVTDIPDWCYVECGMEYGYAVIPSKESYSQMLDKSPILFANNVKCPVMIMIGGKDIRVPPYQGRSLYRALKAMDKVVKMHWYPEDSHPLKGIGTEADVFVNVAKWFHIHCEK